MASNFKYDDFKYKDYAEGDSVINAKAALDAHLATAPGEYQSQYGTALNDALNKITNREKFSYNVNEDALYQQYKDKYIQQGKMAMQDTMGQAASLTGGYGNSYAQAVSQQAYQASLQNLNDVVPQLYSLALERYNQEGQTLKDNYALLYDRESQDYNRYRDTVSDYKTERDYLSNRYDAERDYDYGKYTDARNFSYGQYTDDRNIAYNEHRNAIADAQWQKNYEESVRQYNENKALQERQYEESIRQYNENKALQERQLALEEAKAAASAKTYGLEPEDANRVVSQLDAISTTYGTGATARSKAESYLRSISGLSSDQKQALLDQYFPEEKKNSSTTNTYVSSLRQQGNYTNMLYNGPTLPTKK